MTHQARLHGRSVQVLRPSKSGTGPKRWHTLIKIPKKAKRRKLKPIPGKSQKGFEYMWKAEGRTYRVRIHDADPSVVPTAANPYPNALAGWVVRIRRGKKYMDPEGFFHPAGKVSPKSPSFDELIANETHLPIVPPTTFP